MQRASWMRHSRRPQRTTLPALAPIFLALSFGLPAAARAGGPLPGGGQFVAGAGSIAGNGTSLTINQTSSRGVIDWTSFSIGSGNRVTFDNGAGATLNRVTGGDPSVVLGRLSATGSVYLINPQCVLVGPTGLIATGGRFVASTLDASNAAFMQGGPLTLAGTSGAVVVNLGRISSTGADVFLVARSAVANLGRVYAPNGTAEFAAGQQVLLQDASGSRQVFVLIGSGGDVLNGGIIRAAQVSLQAADGNVYALAGQHTPIRAVGSATRDGHVWLVAEEGGVAIDGNIRAANADGSGGTVDTAAQTLTFPGGSNPIVVAGQWNLSTPSFTVGQDAAGAFARSLNVGTSIDLQTNGGAGSSGDLNVASDIRWHGPASLTLAAYRTVTVAPGTTLANQGSGNLTLRADATGIDNGGSVINNGTVDWSKSAGIVSLLYDMNGSYSPGTLVGNPAWVAAPYSGLVTQLTAYKLVNSLADLLNVSLDPTGNYALGKDIDASATDLGGTLYGQYVPIGTISTPFSGQFDGFGHNVNSLAFDQTVPGDTGQGGVVLQAQGMFGVIGNHGVVRNLGLNGASGGGLSSVEYGAYGILVGVNDGTIVHARTSGSIDLVGMGPNMLSGGLAGANYGTVSRSSSSADLFTEGTLGGLIGINYGSGVIEQSYASGSVNAFAHTGGGGGLAGSSAGSIAQSYATGAVTFSPDYCGGFSGTACTSGGAGLVWNNSGSIKQSFATGAVSQSIPTGQVPSIGIATFNTGTINSDVYWNRDTTLATEGVFSGTAIPAANGLTTAQMSTPSSFVSYDFGSSGVWAMPVGATHPVLRWQVAQ